MSTPEELLSIAGLSKTFDGRRVLSEFDFDLMPGEVHAIVGHNGSGKSTFVKVLSGFHGADAGATMQIAGEEVEFGSATASEEAGLRFVHQNLGLIETLDAVDNVFLGSPYPQLAAGKIDWGRARRETRESLASLGIEVELTLPVRALTPAQRTCVAVARALRERFGPIRVLVFDEPTAALPTREVDALFALIGNLREQGLGIIYISHHLDEVFALAERVTVLRDGVRIATERTAALDEERLVELMIGEGLRRAGRERAHRRQRAEAVPPVLTARRLTTATLDGIDLSIYPGEILGVAGLDGSGREEFAGALFGGLPRGGSVEVDGASLPAHRPDVSVRRRLGMVPADRAAGGVFPMLSVAANMTAPQIATRLHGLLLDRGVELEESQAWAERFAIRPPIPQTPVTHLSGGNQQKVMVARWLRTEPCLLILDEPTQGVDVGAAASIWEMISAVAAAGTAVLVCSSDSEELVSFCDRILVLHGGRVAIELAATEATGEELDAMTLTGTAGGGR